MRPIKDIYKGDVYQVMTGGEFCVLDIDVSEKMVQVQMMPKSLTYPEHLNKPFWKKNTDSLFNKRVMLGWGSRLHSDNSSYETTPKLPNYDKCFATRCINNNTDLHKVLWSDNKTTNPYNYLDFHSGLCTYSHWLYSLNSQQLKYDYLLSGVLPE